MNASRLAKALSMLAAVGLVAGYVLITSASGQKKETPAPGEDAIKDLEEHYKTLVDQNKKLADHLRKTQADLDMTREELKTTRQSLEKAIAAVKKDADDGIKAARKYNHRIEWKVVEINRLNRDRRLEPVDFERPVIEAIAVPVRLDLEFPDTDRYLKRIHYALKVEDIKSMQVNGKQGSRVIVGVHTFMHNKPSDDKWAISDMTSFVVIARVK